MAHVFPRGLLAATLALLLAACQAPSATTPVLRRGAARPQAAAPVLLPLTPGAQRLVAVTTGGTLAGSVGLSRIADPFFRHNAANPYRLLAQSAGEAFVTLTTLDEALLASNGTPLRQTADGDGAFRFAQSAPTGRAYVASAMLARGHRLAALVPAGATTTTLDEATSMVAEMARYQLSDGLTDSGRSLQDLTASELAALTSDTRTLLPDVPLEVEGTVPTVEALRFGAGHVLRNLYVGAFGARVSAAGDGAADRLSDAWQALLGYRPLALTRVAGTAVQNFDQGDGDPADAAPLVTPTAAVSDADGDLYLLERDSGRLRYVPAAGRGGYLRAAGPLAAGRIYTVAGVDNSDQSLSAYNALYGPLEAEAATDASRAPALADGFPLLDPERLVLEPTGSDPHLFFTSRIGHRVMLIPGVDFDRYGRHFEAGRLYTIAGVGDQRYGDTLLEGADTPDDPADDRFAYALGDGGAAHEANLCEPTGLERDADGNLFLLDSGTVALDLAPETVATGATLTAPENDRVWHVYHQGLRIVRASDGHIFSLPLTRPDGGAPYPLEAARDVRLHDGWLYLTDTLHHVVVRLPAPTDLEAWVANPAPQPVEVVLGTPDQPGFMALGPDEAYPDARGAAAGLEVARTLLDGPCSLTFDATGRLLVADRARLRLLDGDRVYTLAGGFATDFLEGDARLALLPGTGYLALEPGGDVLVPDHRAQLVRRLHTRRGAR